MRHDKFHRIHRHRTRPTPFVVAGIENREARRRDVSLRPLVSSITSLSRPMGWIRTSTPRLRPKKSARRFGILTANEFPTVATLVFCSRPQTPIFLALPSILRTSLSFQKTSSQAGHTSATYRPRSNPFCAACRFSPRSFALPHTGHVTNSFHLY